MCWRKLSCLLLVVAQKSSRSYRSAPCSISPSSLVIVIAALFAEGRIGEDHVVAVAGVAWRARLGCARSGSRPPPMPWRYRFIAQRRMTLVDEVDAVEGAARGAFFCARSSPCNFRQVIVGGEQEAAGAAGGIADRLAGLWVA